MLQRYLQSLPELTERLAFPCPSSREHVVVAQKALTEETEILIREAMKALEQNLQEDLSSRDNGHTEQNQSGKV